MHPPRFHSFSHWTPVRSAHAHGALPLAMALIAALACEKAPTETRAPSGPTDMNASSGEVDGLAQRDAETMVISLPVNQNVATAGTNPAFRINQTGSGPNGIFQITNAASTQTALQGLTNSRGRAGLFRIQNTANNQPALGAQTNGPGPAVQGITTSTGSAGSFLVINASNGAPTLTASSNGRGPAGFFQTTNQLSNATLYAENTIGMGGTYALKATHHGNGYAAAFGCFEFPTTCGAGVSISTDGLIALNVAGGPSFFDGDVTVNGTLTKSAGSFRIDHPLQPEHKYLSHSFVESPDMMNVYNGNATLDASGRATVELPDYFEALNRDFRYQLTPIGAPGPNLYIAEGVQQNRFRIAGGRAYAHVSWQVTGVRQDTYANEHRIKVEEDKAPAEGELVARR
jgi:hypothetical protein